MMSEWLTSGPSPLMCSLKRLESYMFKSCWRLQMCLCVCVCVYMCMCVCVCVLCIQILTKDSVTARVDAVVYFRIVNPTSSIVKVENAYNSTYLLAQTTLRSVLGTKKLGELLSERETISAEMQVCRCGREWTSQVLCCDFLW